MSAALNVITFRSTNDQKFYFRIRGGNNQTICPSEAYDTAQKRDQTVGLLSKSMTLAYVKDLGEIDPNLPLSRQKTRK